jgi:hypothetical protein
MAGDVILLICYVRHGEVLMDNREKAWQKQVIQ